MKEILIICGLALSITACNSDSEESLPLKDTSAQTGQSTVDTTGQHKDHIMDMHNAMAQMTLRMQALEPTGDADYDFAAMMKIHHQGAIDMAKTEVDGGSDGSLKQMAQKIIDDQQKEIDAFDRLLNGPKPSGTSQFSHKAMGDMTDLGMMKKDSSSIDELFAKMMIPHHEEAVKMSQDYLPVSKNAEIKQIAESIIKTQTVEVKQLQDWLSKKK